jgi:hypothetical protein
LGEMAAPRADIRKQIGPRWENDEGRLCV